MALATSEKRELGLLGAYAVIAVIALVIADRASDTDTAPILTMWLLGAAALGLVSGFTTGASKLAGAGAQLIGFISGGVIVPILGGVVALVQQPEASTATPAKLHPLWVAGSFFAAYSIFAIIGIAVGIRRRADVNGGINLTR